MTHAACSTRLEADRLVHPGQTLRLLPGRFLSLAPEVVAQARREGATLALQAVHGAVWVTWAGGLEDAFLRPGESLALPAGVAGLLVQTEPRLAEGPAHVRLLSGTAGVLRGAGIDSTPSCTHHRPSTPPAPTHPLLPWWQRLVPRPAALR